MKILSKENIDINGNILAKGIGDIGGDIVFMSEKNVKIGEKSIVDVSGQNKGVQLGL